MAGFFCPLEQDALLHVVGPDGVKFLQGQTTCNTESVSETLSVPGAYCTPQGRAVCDFLLSRIAPDHLALRMRRDIIDNSAAVFGKYIIFSKATLEPAREDWRCVGVWGDSAELAISGLVDTAPTEPYAVGRGDGLIAVRLPGETYAVECYLEATSADAHLAALEQSLSRGEENHWHQLQIHAGIARISSETVETFIPQVLNFDLTGHVNFKKGCYTGQEVVARLHYRGTPKRRTYLATLANETPPTAGTEVFAPGSSQSVGNIVFAAQVEGTVDALVAVTLDAAEGELHLGGTEGERFTVTPPPYSLEKT